MAKTNGSAQPNFPSFMDMSKFMPDMNNMKMPGIDVESIAASQRRNAETFSELGQKTFACMQALMQRQSEMMREGLKESAGLFNEVMAAGSPEEKVARQTEIAKSTMEKAMANCRELIDMATQNNREAAEIMTQRVSAAMDELREACQRRP